VERSNDFGDIRGQAEEHLRFFAKTFKKNRALGFGDGRNLQALQRHRGAKRTMKRPIHDSKAAFGDSFFDREGTLGGADDAEDILGHPSKHTLSQATP
jgi:hypothetical protein